MTAASRKAIEEWFDWGANAGATHLIIVCDTYDFDDYPVWIMPGESVHEQLLKYKHEENMQRVMEVYSYALDRDMQLNEHRAWHLDQARQIPEIIQEEP